MVALCRVPGRRAAQTAAGGDPVTLVGRLLLRFAPDGRGRVVATVLEEDRPSTLIGTSVLTFTSDGLVATARDYWSLEPGTHLPFDGWGR